MNQTKRLQVRTVSSPPSGDVDELIFGEEEYCISQR